MDEPKTQKGFFLFTGTVPSKFEPNKTKCKYISFERRGELLLQAFCVTLIKFEKNTLIKFEKKIKNGST